MSDPGSSVPELCFEAGLPGFPDARRFALVRLSEDAGPDSFSFLRSLEAEGPEFVVVPPGVFFPDYAPEIDDELAQRLDLSSADDALLLVLVTVADEVADSTANLLGPVVVNRHTLSAAQAVLDPGRYRPRQPLLTR